MYPLSPFHNFGWVRYVVPPEFGGSNFSNTDYKRTVKDINDLFFAKDRFMYTLSPFHNFGSVGPKEIEIIEAAWPIPAFAKKFTKIEGALLTSSQSKLESSHRRVEDVGAHVCKQ